jgi:transcription elongation factor GreA
MLRNAQVGEAPSGDAVTAGMIVTTVDGDGDESTFLLGSREDRVSGVPVVSAQSPLGKALMGKKVGQKASYEAPAGTFTVTVTAIKPATA